METSKRPTWQNPLLTWLGDRYESILRRLLRWPALVALCAVVIIGASLYLGTRLGTEFLSNLDEGVMWIRANLPSGTSLEKSANVASEMRELIKRHPEVLLVSSQSGRNDSGTDPFGPNRNEFLITLRPYSSWPAGRTKQELVATYEES